MLSEKSLKFNKGQFKTVFKGSNHDIIIEDISEVVYCINYKCYF